MKKGFTLVELLVYVAVLGIILVFLASLLYWVIRIRARLKADREVVTSARLVMDRIGKEIRNAEGIYTPTTNDTQLSLSTRRFLPSGEDSTYIDFFICGEEVCMKKEFESPVSLTGAESTVNTLLFERLSGSPISIKTTLEITSESFARFDKYKSSIDISSVFSLRNATSTSF